MKVFYAEDNICVFDPEDKTEAALLGELFAKVSESSDANVTLELDGQLVIENNSDAEDDEEEDDE